MSDNFIIKHLVCPCCGSDMKLTDDNKTLVCLGKRVHCFDISAKGYVNLSLSQSESGDSRSAVSTRSSFLNKGYYAPIAQKIVELLSKYKKTGVVVDAGCGEGYYTNKIAESGYLTAGFDLSKFAIASTARRMMCKTNPSAFAAVASVFELPLKADSADAVLSIFAPCAEGEFERILKKDGIVIVVSAGENHLMGLKKAIYEEAYKNDARADMPKKMKLVECEEIEYSICVEGNDDILNLFSMTPYYWRTSPRDSEKLKSLASLTTEINILFSIYAKE